MRPGWIKEMLKNRGTVGGNVIYLILAKDVPQKIPENYFFM
jgi:hypothetical protein